ncbi:MAG: DUF2974 domain-containing protein [Actinomycetota bacterium]|nr:DUF2974 domain-containing protein [Actinomycetota bacterium]
MATITDYVRTYQHTFTDRPLNRVDGLVFSWLANTRIPEHVPAACTGTGATIAGFGGRDNVLDLVAPVYDPASTEDLLRACAASPRFGNVVACHAVDEWSQTAQEQFSAVTFLLPQGAFLAFRGTDNTIVGWKEDFNMSFCSVVPAQEAARRYVEWMSEMLACPLWLGGHSKGGNLALFAVAHCNPLARLRVERCHVYDAPGLSKEAIASSSWDDAVPLISHTVAEESFMGLLLDSHGVAPEVVRSSNSGVFQHAPLSWIVEDGDFVTSQAVAYDAYRTNKRLTAWMGSLSTEERERFVEVLFELIQTTGEVTITGFLDSISKGSLDVMLRKLDVIPENDRTFFMDALGDLAATMLLGPAPRNPQTPEEHVDVASDKIDDLTARFNSISSKLDKIVGE